MTASVQTPRAMTAYLALGSLYFAQGLPFGFFTQALPVLLRRQGYSLGAIGLASMLAMPWGLKFLWSPAVDRYTLPTLGRRKVWIVPTQLLSSLTLIGIAFLPWQTNMQLVLAGVLLSNLMTATQDIATDGMAVDLMKPSERGIANGLKVGGYRAGMVIGGGAILAAYSHLDWRGTFLLMAALIAIATLPVFSVRESEPIHVATSRPSVHYLRRPGVGRILFILITYKLCDEFATEMLKPFFVDLGLTISDIGWLVGTVGFMSGLFGAVCGGALVNRIGRRRSLVTFGFLQALTIGGYAILAATRPGYGWLAMLCASEHFCAGMATAALFTNMMDWSSKQSSATDYSVQASTVVLAKGIAAVLAGFSAQRLGYFNHFMLAAGLGLAAIVVVHFFFPDKEQIAMVTGDVAEVPSCV